jgi:hypothetical protein
MGAANLAGKVTKALKLAKKANKKADAALAASKQPGPAGPAGPTGPTGPSNGYVSASAASVTWTFSQQSLATIPVQAGSSYVLDSFVVADNNGAVGSQAYCRLRLAGTDLLDTTVFLGANGTADDETISLTGAGTASVNGTAELRCTSFSTTGVWNSPKLTAIRVGSVN